MTSVAGQGVSLAGRYRLDKLIASGAAGQVWRALDLLLERNVAVKLLRPGAAGDQEARARFRAEARNASRLSHPGVAQVYDYGEDGSPDLPFLVMELVDGPSLAEVLAAGPLDPGRTMDLIAQVGDGLHAAHSGGLVHRDIKPANLLITGDGQVKITDFGIASVTPGAPSAATGILLGTPAYLAPERAAGRPATPASDLYSLGVVGYECLTGAPPFRGPALQVAEAHLRHPFPALPATVPAEVAALVAALTAKNTRDRPGSAREVAERAGKLRTAGKITRPGAISPIPASGGPPAAPCLTLPDIGAQATQAGQPAFGGRPVTRQPRSARKRIGAGLAVAAAMTAAGLAGWQAGLTGAATPHSAAAARHPTAQSPPMVLVSSASLVGQQPRVVLADLRRLGLRPRLAWVPAPAQPPGTVLSVQPGGALPPGTVVTVAVAAQPAQQGDQTGDGGDGNGGNDGGDGGSDGGGGDGGGNGH
jgi:serine/threonine-protein kinase